MTNEEALKILKTLTKEEEQEIKYCNDFCPIEFDLKSKMYEQYISCPQELCNIVAASYILHKRKMGE